MGEPFGRAARFCFGVCDRVPGRGRAGARGWIRLRKAAESWRWNGLRAGLEEIALAGARAVEVSALHHFHAKPADRFIVAIALVRGATLVTADRRNWCGLAPAEPAGRPVSAGVELGGIQSFPAAGRITQPIPP